MEPDSPLPPESSVGRVALRVGDLDRVAGFYESVVGLDVQQDGEDRAVLGAGGSPLCVLQAAPDAPGRRAEQAGLFHTAFRVPSRAALGDALARVESDWELEGASDHNVSEALYLSDPEGNGVEIYRDRPRGEWPETEDGRVQMETLPLDLEDLQAEGEGGAAAPDATTVGHVHLEATSLSRAREFYVGAVGLRVRQVYGSGGLFLAAGDYHHHLGVNTWNGRTDPAGGRGLAFFELLVPGGPPDAVRGYLDDRCGVREVDSGIEVRDPDGIAVRLRRPR